MTADATQLLIEAEMLAATGASATHIVELIRAHLSAQPSGLPEYPETHNIYPTGPDSCVQMVEKSDYDLLRSHAERLAGNDARYRLIQPHIRISPSGILYFSVDLAVGEDKRCLIRQGDEVDAAIDAAIAKEQGNE